MAHDPVLNYCVTCTRNKPIKKFQKKHAHKKQERGKFLVVLQLLANSYVTEKYSIVYPRA
jgi:hypothetical protein